MPSVLSNGGLFLRRIFLTTVCAVLLVLLCTSCSKGGGLLVRTPQVAQQFETEMKICAGELELTASVKRYGTELWEMEVTSPETLAGLTVTLNADGAKAALDDLEMTIAPENIREGAVFSLLFKAMDNVCTTGKLNCEESDNGLVYTGDFSGMLYNLTFAKSDLSPLSLEIPSAAFTAQFLSFTEISG